MDANRRAFFKTAMSLGLASSAYSVLAGCAASDDATDVATGYDLVPDPNGLLDLPEGFTYTMHSPAGEVMSDGLRVPYSHDGMACFPVEGDPDRCILVRNHEVDYDEAGEGPFAGGQASDDVLARAYDIGADGNPLPGGTTTLLFNLRTREVERSHLSLAGTLRNCSGGMTPWGTWLTCEETLDNPGSYAQKHHGYVFEVPAMEQSLAEPVALTAMGRFRREATATDPRTSIVYQTEDEDASLIYRFLPDVPGQLSAGGRLQVLSIKGQPQADTRNWAGVVSFAEGESLDVEWLNIDEVESPNGDLAQRGHALGAAYFARGEGMCFAVEQTGNAVYFACTSGGAAECGQIWKYVPSEFEGTDGEEGAPGQLTLHYESPAASEMDMCDNIVGAPWGDLIICEDCDNLPRVRGVSPDGRVYPIAQNVDPGRAEFAGACFSPDGETLFVNMQGPHVTFAIRGPWAQIIRA
ncbi:alkaline phosphatase PhoX [Ponticaulis sp.]|uniref:alkaline phosphatase PhoX n=1 Tax=Ponticaulis sp. TaxID=2020902 RepID=UPI000B65D52F|nr:alkaline phosphatase PhoX [Ponticaulis sp.]MAI90395.1 phosphatase [Ponticaulis sp.]OUY00097.1 MAG: hypothetical protein CBB65_08145 [Hyphomonadaceae bacterium TMED5]|tara:strand:+ start:10522 stop:11922 length:1401 start_codon:yes stop_codon:yes gene_type:complete